MKLKFLLKQYRTDNFKNYNLIYQTEYEYHIFIHDEILFKFNKHHYLLSVCVKHGGLKGTLQRD